MKKNYLFLLLVTFGIASAQVPNPSFEEFIGYGNETRFWGPNPMSIAISIDLEGNTTTVSETIIYEPDTYSYCFFNNDAHTGNRAMEIRNAFNVTKNEVIPGKMILFNEDEGSTTASGWNTGQQISDNITLEGLGFYYKFFPLNNDTAQAKLELFNSGGESVGIAVVEISGLHSDYTYASAPIEITSTETPTFMTVEFSMGSGTTNATMGSKLIIDDVSTTNLPLSNPFVQASQFLIYPTLASQEIHIAKGDNMLDGSYAIEIFTLDGRAIKRLTLDLYEDTPATIDVSALSQGVYFMKANEVVTKFIKK